ISWTLKFTYILWITFWISCFGLSWQLPGNSRLLNQARTEASGQPSFAHPGSDSLYPWRPDSIYLLANLPIHVPVFTYCK
ncbi:hypothetical protein ILYODFUR_012017, partial [Ilyodon furcidens]